MRSIPTQLEEFFAQEWVQREDTVAEIMYIKRASRKTDKWSGHVAFPGGRMEGEDEVSVQSEFAREEYVLKAFSHYRMEDTQL